MTAIIGDKELLARIVDRDETALRQLIARHQARVFRFIAARVRDAAVVEELTSEVFVEVWTKAHTFEGRSSPSTWLLAIAHNRAVSATRRRREEVWSDDEAGALVDESDDPEVSLQKSDKSALMRACLQRLSAEHREIIQLVYYQEQSITEVAEVLAIPQATVKTRMFYARKKLSEVLKAAGVDRGWP